MSLFQESIIRKHLGTLDQEVVDRAYVRFKEVYSANKITNIKIAKEEQYQEGFIKDIFGEVLGYSVFPSQPFNIQTEKKNESDSKKADGAIFQGENVVGVIELKDNKTKNLDAVKDQAFGYKNNHRDCSYVISSNFHKLRFYVDDATEYEEFDLYNLDKETFKRFYLYLRKEGLLDKNIPKLLRQETKFHEENITKSLYKDYSSFKNSFFQNVVENNPQYDKLLLFKKSQKFLDKVLFVLFAEDKGLVNTNSIVQIVEKWNDLKNDAFDTPKPLYQLVVLFFNNLFKGKYDQKGSVLIPEFGGEIFAPDEVLDTLIVDDTVLKDDLLKLSRYDFNTDVDVNILGHIFEHSLSEIEEVEAELKGEIADKTKGKRKKDGVFYTPKYITKYIVENTVGKLCAEKKSELKLDIDIAISEHQKTDGKLNAKGIELYETLNQYKSWLLSIKILDPACGSGAFLNQAVNFLVQEHQFVDDIIAELTNTPLRLFDTDLAILENNIYGVDINEESVEIAKLSLWLRTAKQGRKLSNLNNNIKCGNSLIDDPAVAGDKAFNWHNEFPEVFAKGGFDVVIGNPPYLLCQPSNTDEKKLNYFQKYLVASYKIDLFHLFFEKSITLLKEKGKLGFITPNTYLTNKYIQKLRNFILKNTLIETVVNYEDPVFVDAGVDVATIILKKEKASNGCIEIFNSNLGIIHQFGSKKQTDWLNDSENTFNIKHELKFDFKNCVKFEDIGNSYFGIQAYDRKKSISNIKENESYLPLIDGAEINRYELSKPNKFINFITENIKSGGDYSVYERLRIVVRQIGRTPIIGLCEPNILTSNTLYNLYTKNENYSLKYVLTILNSKVIKKYWLAKYSDSKQLFPKIKGYQLKQLPIPITSYSGQLPFIEKADMMLSLNKELQEQSLKFQRSLERKFLLTELSKKLQDWYLLSYADFVKELEKKKIKLSLSHEAEWETYFTSEAKKALDLKAQIEKTDKEIDQMVYALYDLTEDEIKIVEGS
jgi:type I restriction-modification system DNA methylase subunit